MLAATTRIAIRQTAPIVAHHTISNLSRSSISLLSTRRWFASAPAQKPEETEEAIEERLNAAKPGAQAVTWGSVAFLAFAGGGILAYFLYTQDKALNTVRVESIGTAKVGGSWALTNDEGKTVRSEDLHGKYPLIYFGFTHCPDICPRELERMDEIIKKMDAMNLGHLIAPIFVTIDPKRDTVDRMRTYKLKWNPRIQFLVPTDEQLKDLAQKFRLYYSASETTPGQEDDYLLDHSIFFYMMDQEGKFLEVYSQYLTTDDVALKIAGNINADKQ